MKRLIGVAVAVIALGTAAFAGPFVLGELVPSRGTFRPYIGGGYDTGWSIVSFTVSMEHALVLDGWYGLSVAPVWDVTGSGNVRIGGVVSGWVEVCSGVPTSSSVGMGGIGVARWQGINVFAKLLLFRSVSGSSVLFGLQPVVGLFFDFSPCCGTPPPGCGDLGGDCPERINR